MLLTFFVIVSSPAQCRPVMPHLPRMTLGTMPGVYGLHKTQTRFSGVQGGINVLYTPWFHYVALKGLAESGAE